MTDALPASWTSARLAELAAVNPSRVKPDADPTTVFNFVGMASIREYFGGIDVSRLRPLSEVTKGFTQFKEGDVLLAKITPCFENGKLAVVPPLAHTIGYGSTELHVMRPSDGVEAKWLAYWLARAEFRVGGRLNMKGSAGQLRIPKDWLGEQVVPVAPSAEQRRIVAKIEELLSDLDAGAASLDRVLLALQNYRASVLKAAFAGGLTQTWREERSDVEPADHLLQRLLTKCRAHSGGREQVARNGGKLDGATHDNLPALPTGWCWATLSQLGTLDRGRSRHRPRNDPGLYGGPYPFVQTGDIRKADTYVREHRQTYSEVGLEQSRLWPAGTLCMTIAANIANTAILAFDACFPDSVVGFRPFTEDVSTRFLELYLRTMQSQLEAFAPATAQKNINLKILQDLPVRLPPSEEQEEIVGRVDSLLSASDHLTTELSTLRGRSTRLRQLVLKRAFSGQLVPQDSSDEPASCLLERIAAVRDREGSIRPRRRASRHGTRVALTHQPKPTSPEAATE